MASTQGFGSHPENINRKGAPQREWTWAGIVEKEVERLGGKELGTRKEKLKKTMVKKMIELVLKGDVQAFRELSNRTDGSPKQTVDTNFGFKKETLEKIEELTKSILDKNE